MDFLFLFSFLVDILVNLLNRNNCYRIIYSLLRHHCLRLVSNGLPIASESNEFHELITCDNLNANGRRPTCRTDVGKFDHEAWGMCREAAWVRQNVVIAFSHLTHTFCRCRMLFLVKIFDSTRHRHCFQVTCETTFGIWNTLTDTRTTAQREIICLQMLVLMNC